MVDIVDADIGARVERARVSAGLSQRTLAHQAGISQPTLSRIISGARTPKVPELLAIANATGCSLAELIGSGVAERVQCVARATNGSSMDEMRAALIHYLELDAYLEDQGIPART